ncbi:MAG: hypothetical protein L6R41_003999 [Letrouitia leprolyta]|nr:MAG: hypothetical protein L6R41_003999 [Letrouitia leprolyta]
MPTIGECLSRIYATNLQTGQSPSVQNGRFRLKQDPELSRDRTNVVLLYGGSFNPPHRGHLAVLWHAYTQLARDLNVVAALVYPGTDERVKEKCDSYPPGERHHIPLRDRHQLWMSDPNFPPWACVIDRFKDGWHHFEHKLNQLTGGSGIKIRVAILCGPDNGGPDNQLNSPMEITIVSDIAREAEFDHEDGLKRFVRRGFYPWFVDNGVMTLGNAPAETRKEMLDRWNELQQQQQQQITAGEERTEKTAVESHDSGLDISANLTHGASNLAVAKVDGLLGLDEETSRSLVGHCQMDTKSLATHLAALGSPKSSSICWKFQGGRIITVRFLRATPGQYAPFRGISSSEIQKAMRELKGHELFSALKSMALSPALLWDML